MFARSGLADRGWTLRLAGDSALAADLKSLAEDLGIAAACEFLGYRDDVGSLQRSAAVMLAPCPIEGFGLSVVEAMAWGTPVVAAREGAHAETVGADPIGGALYPAEDVAVGGHILGDVADNPQRRQLYGNSLRDLQQREFSIQSMVGRTLAFYRTVT